jgi:predicted nucleic acid-binding Zn ribbon protein
MIEGIVQPLQSFAPAVLADIIRRQPASQQRTDFAWSVAVGPALARVTTVELRNHNMIVCARDVQWARELERARDTILPRLQMLLGRETVKGLYINA